MNIPDSMARHVRSRTVIADISANPETARRRMSAANGQLTKARNYLAKEDWEASAIFAESALMVAFEAYLMGVKLKRLPSLVEGVGQQGPHAPTVSTPCSCANSCSTSASGSTVMDDGVRRSGSRRPMTARTGIRYVRSESLTA